MSKWVVIASEGNQIYQAMVYGPFASQQLAEALARGLTDGSVNGRIARAVRMEKP